MTVAHRALAAVGFVAYYLWNLSRANVLVALEVLRPMSRMAPGIVRVPAHGDRAWKVWVFAQLVSLTPGTLTLDVSEDLGELYVHGLHVHSVEEFRAHLAELESRLLAVIG